MRPRMPYRGVLLAALAGLLAAWAGSVALPAQPAPVPEVLRRIAGDAPVRSLPPGDYTVRFFYFGPDRQPMVATVAAAGIFVFDSRVFVAERNGPRWFVGDFNASDPRAIDCEIIFDSGELLERGYPYPPLPQPPAGLRVREVVRMPDFPVRLASDGRGQTLYVLCVNGDVYHVTIADGRLRKVLDGDDYHTAGALERQALGLLLDGEGRLYIASNERLARVPRRNQVTLFRAQTSPDGSVAKPEVWLREWYPWGIGAFNHGINHLAIGPDGMLYVSSGSRTNGNEPGEDPLYSPVGEVELTACIWRLDPRATRPQIEIYARGLRNAFGFCWNDRGEMLATDNGPDADAPEELNLIERGKHYGFPYEFSDWGRSPYPYAGTPPPGLRMEKPIPNFGPAAGGHDYRPIFTFDPHSSPGGICYLRKDWPPPWRGGYFITRFGNLLTLPRDVGMDLLHATLRRGADGRYQARVTTVLAPLGRPVDLHLSGRGRLYVAEYSRQTRNDGYSAQLPGRIIEVSAAQ